MAEDVSKLALPELADKFRFIRNQKKMLTVAENAMKERVLEEMGEDSELVLTSDYKAVKQLKKYYGITPEKAKTIVEDDDLFAQIVTVDLKKAEEILPPELLKELKRALTIEKTTEALVFKGFDNNK